MPRGTFGDDRAGEPVERVPDDLWQSGRARGQHQPFGRLLADETGGGPFGRQTDAGDQMPAGVEPVRRDR